MGEIVNTVAAKSCIELYTMSPDFRAFIACWIEDRRCPYGLGDWLEEMGLDRQAEAARWAATEVDRPVFSAEENVEKSGPFPLFPIYESDEPKGCAYWFVGNMSHANCIPEHTKVADCQWLAVDKCLLFLLDGWKRGREHRDEMVKLYQ